MYSLCYEIYYLEETQATISTVSNYWKNPYWPLKIGSDMVHECCMLYVTDILLYILVHELYLTGGVQDDVGLRASMKLSQHSKFIVWPEVSD